MVSLLFLDLDRGLLSALPSASTPSPRQPSPPAPASPSAPQPFASSPQVAIMPPPLGPLVSPALSLPHPSPP